MVSSWSSRPVLLQRTTSPSTPPTCPSSSHPTHNQCHCIPITTQQVCQLWFHLGLVDLSYCREQLPANTYNVPKQQPPHPQPVPLHPHHNAAGLPAMVSSWSSRPVLLQRTTSPPTPTTCPSSSHPTHNQCHCIPVTTQQVCQLWFHLGLVDLSYCREQLARQHLQRAQAAATPPTTSATASPSQRVALVVGGVAAAWARCRCWRVVVLCNKTGRLDQDETIAGRPAAL